jgi:DNA-binding MarR family transcriptional regulator
LDLVQCAALNEGLKKAEPELSIPLLRTLLAVAVNENLSVNELADHIEVPQQTASRYVAILQGRYQTSEAGASLARAPLLTHRASSTDLRRYELVLTPKGGARVQAILATIFDRRPAR